MTQNTTNGLLGGKGATGWWGRGGGLLTRDGALVSFRNLLRLNQRQLFPEGSPYMTGDG